MMQRRTFLRQAATGSVGLALPLSACPPFSYKKRWKKLKFGIIADLHKDLIPEADGRLETFMDKLETEFPDFIISLGDFCFGIPENRYLVDKFARAHCPAYHVLGNHDMDRHTKAEMADFFRMPGRYYSCNLQGYHIVVLDANNLYKDGQFIDYQNANFYIDDKYREFIDTAQIEWFKADIAATDLPTIVFSHQSLYHPVLGVKNRLVLQLIMEEENKKAGYNKVFACFNGHNHLDYHREINGIHYFDINSMSYQWCNEPNYERYGKGVYEKYRNMQHIALYRNPLFAFVSVEAEGSLVVKGVESEWMPPAPDVSEQILGTRSSPVISNRKIAIS